MSDIQKGRLDRPRDEGVIVPPIQGDKKGKQPYTQIPENQGKRILFASFFSALKKAFDSLVQDEGSLGGRVIEKQTSLETILAFKSLMEELASKDLSQDADFALHLSELWHKMQEDFSSLQILERKNPEKVTAYRLFLETINRYPRDADHTLGFYLFEQAGKNWLPFPFIEMLATLHGEQKTLNHWIDKLKQLATLLKGSLSK